MTPPIDPALAARTELATPFRYHLAAQPPPQEPWWLRAWGAFVDFLNRFFAHVHGGHSIAVTISWIVLAITGVLILYVIARLVLVAMSRPSAAAEIEELRAERKDAHFAREAFAAAERGDMTAAVRLLLRAAISQLDLRGEIEDDASATIGELRREVKPLGVRVAEPFDAIASAYVAGVYAQRPVEVAAWNRARTAYEALRASA